MPINKYHRNPAQKRNYPFPPSNHQRKQVDVVLPLKTRHPAANSLDAMRPSTLFFSCIMPEKSTRKAGLEVCRWSLHPVFDWERNTRSRQNLPVCECNIQALFSLYCLHTGCFQDKRFARVGAERQTNITVFEPK